MVSKAAISASAKSARIVRSGSRFKRAGKPIGITGRDAAEHNQSPRGNARWHLLNDTAGNITVARQPDNAEMPPRMDLFHEFQGGIGQFNLPANVVVADFLRV